MKVAIEKPRRMQKNCKNIENAATIKNVNVEALRRGSGKSNKASARLAWNSGASTMADKLKIPTGIRAKMLAISRLLFYRHTASHGNEKK